MGGWSWVGTCAEGGGLKGLVVPVEQTWAGAGRAKKKRREGKAYFTVPLGGRIWTGPGSGPGTCGGSDRRDGEAGVSRVVGGYAASRH